jgi:hypothetical protein
VFEQEVDDDFKVVAGVDESFASRHGSIDVRCRKPVDNDSRRR